GSSAAIGVTADPNPSSTASYFSNDYSLTLPPGLGVDAGATTFVKVGLGDLILPNDSLSFTAPVDIQQGWITIETSNGLGGQIATASQNTQPPATVETAASLTLRPAAGQSLTLNQNFLINGVGIDNSSSNFSQLVHEGAILSLNGVNYVRGNLTLGGIAGVGA